MSSVGDAKGSVRLPGVALETEKVVKPFAPAISSTPSLRDPELVSMSTAELWNDNAKVQFAWDLRDALMVRLQSTAKEKHTPAMRFVGEVLGKIAAHQVDPDLANRAMYALARGLFPDKVYLRMDEVVEKLLERSVPQLKTAFAELNRAERTRKTSRAPAALPLSELGRSIIAAMWNDPDPKISELFSKVRYAPAFVWGSLAEATGSTDLASFLKDVRASSSAELQQCAEWAASVADPWLAMSGAIGASTSKAAVSDLRALALKPESSPILAAQIDRLANGIGEGFGLDPESLRLQLRTRQRDAVQSVLGVEQRLVSSFGATRAAAIFAKLDLAAEVASISDPKDGIRYYTDLDSPLPLRNKTEALELRLGEEGVRMLADELHRSILADPALAPLAELLREHLKDALYSRAALASVLKRSVPAKEGEGHGAYLSRLGRELSQPGALEKIKRGLGEELRADAGGFLGDLASHFELYHGIERGLREDQAHRTALHSKMERGIMPISRDTLQQIEAHMDACYPQEGLGYLASDGRQSYFFPVRNLIAALGLGHDRGEDDPKDVERLAEALAGTGLELIAKVHSHPDQPPVFSDGDLEGMRACVGIAPQLRTMILGVTPAADGVLHHRLASFSSTPLGTVQREDKIEVA